MNSKKGSIIGYVLVAITLAAVDVLAQSTEKFNDAEIAAIAVAANDIDIQYAQIAVDKSKDKEILSFANTMINDHQTVIDQAVELVTKLEVEPQPNTLSDQLNADAQETKKVLQAKQGKAFDEAYINNEVTYHKAVISVVRDDLIPSTENNQLKDLLESVLPALEAHLKHAESIQKKISRG